MSLPAPNLDDRRFQDIVDEAKRRITRYCPEWTDHNVSDPGVALIELFAWMTEMILYRVNQVPDRLYVKFLELVGIELFSAAPARTDLLFTLAAPSPEPIRMHVNVGGVDAPGIDPRRPPRMWQSWDGSDWREARILEDTSEGFNSSGEVTLLLPARHEPLAIGAVRAHWLRCRLVDVVPG